MIKYPLKFDLIASKGIDSLVFQEKNGGRLFVDVPTEFGGKGKFSSPEDLYLMALVSCYLTTVEALTTDIINYQISANLVLDRSLDGNVFCREANINYKFFLSEQADRSHFDKLLDQAKDYCFIWNSVKTKLNITTEIC